MAATITTANNNPGGTVVPIYVTDFTNIGDFTLTLRFNITKALFVSAVPDPALSSMSIVYTPPASGSVGKIVMSWTNASNVSLPDSTHLADLTFTYLTGTAALAWAYTYGNVCQYQSWSGGSLTLLNDVPKTSFYINGAISDRTAPVTYAPDLGNPAAGSLSIPITTTGFNNIGAITLTLEYDTAILVYQNSFTPNAAFVGNFLVGNQAGTGSLMKIRIQWYGSRVYLPDGSNICTLDFNYIGGSSFSALTWLDNGSSCEYADSAGNVLIDWPLQNFYKNGTIGVNTIDIIIEKDNSCGSFTVALQPPAALQDNLTQLIFTVQWPAVAGTDVQITAATAVWPGLAQVGSRVLDNGNYYVSFTSTTAWAVNWAAGSQNTVMHFYISANGEGVTGFNIIASDYSTTLPGNNTAYSIDVAGSDATGSIINNAVDASLNCRVFLRTILQGAFDTTLQLMRTDLVANNLVPANHPYNKLPWNYGGAESSTTIPSDVTDWVLVELRTGIDATTVIARKAGLLKSDGTIVDADGVSQLLFYDMVAGNQYYVAVHHRNHFPVMSANSITLPNLPATTHDFSTDIAANVYSVTADGAIKLDNNNYGQISGELNFDNILIYSGPNNDRAPVFLKISAIYTPPPANLTSIIEGYYSEDLNMNGIVKYSGPNNDPSIIIQNIDFFTNPTYLTSVYVGQVPVSYGITKSAIQSASGTTDSILYSDTIVISLLHGKYIHMLHYQELHQK